MSSPEVKMSGTFLACVSRQISNIENHSSADLSVLAGFFIALVKKDSVGGIVQL
jgi:hypothetical protein